MKRTFGSGYLIYSQMKRTFGSGYLIYSQIKRTFGSAFKKKKNYKKNQRTMDPPNWKAVH
jgi:hypothetical protein